MDLMLRKVYKGSIEGRLIRADGTPGPSGTPVTLIAVDTREGGEVSAGLAGFGETDDEGRYSFLEVAPGRYRIVLNLYRVPTQGNPFPTIYWPASREESQAFAVQVTDAPFERRYDFRLTPEPAFAVISGTALFADGRPAAGVRIQIDVPPDNLITEEEDEPVTDTSGHFSFTALEGYEYRISAFTYSLPIVHSAEESFSLAQGHRFVTLLLDQPGRWDGDPAVLHPTPQDQ